MNFLDDPRVTNVRSNASTLVVDFEDGRSIHLPLLWFPRLFNATQSQRNHWRLIGPGVGVHWPDVDEDLSAAGLFAGRPSIEYLKQRRQKQKAAA
jgi:hypothetical protein